MSEWGNRLMKKSLLPSDVVPFEAWLYSSLTGNACYKR